MKQWSKPGALLREFRTGGRGIRKRAAALLLAVSMAAALCSCSSAPGQEEVSGQTFTEFIDELWRDNITGDTLSLHYSLAHPENYNISVEEVTLGRYSQEESTASVEENEACIRQLKSYDYDALNEEEQLIYDCTLAALEANSRLIAFPYYAEPLGPVTGLQAELPILLAEYHFYSRADIDTYLELLKCLPDYFSDIAAYEREKSAAGLFMSDGTADEIIDQCKKFIAHPEENLLIEHFNSVIASFDGLTTDEITLYQEQNREAVLTHVIPAYELLIETLTGLKGTSVNEKGLSGFPDGAAYFEALAQYETGSSMTVRQMKKRLASAVKTALVSMSAAQMANPDIYNQYLNATYPTSDPTEGLELLKEAIRQDFPALADVDYSVKYVHKSLQDYLSPAMYLIPPFDDRTNNNIYINQNPDYSSDGIFTTLAHEGYPGHLYQNVYYLSTSPAPIRHLLRTRGYTEGWGTYAELYGYELAGFNDELAAFLQNNMTAILCLYGLSEIGVHSEGWGLSETVSFWADYGIDEDTASNIYQDLVAEPGVYLPYCIGYLEFIDLRKKAQKTLGDSFSYLEFHTFLLKIGPAPFDIIEKHMDQWLENIGKNA
ncbi:MAG: DUF885 domain-containing protein [Lachnospiraceae bacterium]|nr:DUF885 domain-containing protein [Lachnospiraceae bacterium]